MVQHTNIAIIGGSFGGLSAYHILKKRVPDATIRIFDFRKNFTWIPGLHEAIGNPGRLHSLQIPLKQIAGDEFINQKATAIREHALTTTDGQEWTFDYAVIATGSTTNFYGKKEFKKHCYTVRYPDDIPKLNKALPNTNNITIIGGGFTGIEIASIIAKRNYGKTIRLIHSKERLVERLSPSISRICQRYLEKNGVELLLESRAVAVDEKTVTTKDGTVYPSEVTILSSGIQINDEQHKEHLTFKGNYSPEESGNIYLAGDVAIHGLYTTAHNAVMEGRRMGHLIADKIEGKQKTYPPLKNRDKLAIALGEYDGVVAMGKKGIFLPGVTGVFKRIVEKKVLFEFATGILFPF